MCVSNAFNNNANTNHTSNGDNKPNPHLLWWITIIVNIHINIAADIIYTPKILLLTSKDRTEVEQLSFCFQGL